jgi:hypothetical protein
MARCRAGPGAGIVLESMQRERALRTDEQCGKEQAWQ